MGQHDFELLFSPVKIRRLTLKNRIVMPAMGNRYPSFSGRVTERLIRYYQERAKGGPGLIIVQFACVTSSGRSSHYPLGVWEDAQVPGLQALVKVIQEAGVPVGIQLAHVGAMGEPAITGLEPVGPSPIPCHGRNVPRALRAEEICSLVEAFSTAGARALEAGFDAIELHMAHGYLLQQFLSPLSNQRTDDYGGDFQRRLRFPLEVLAGVRKAIGDDAPVICRLCVDEGVPGGLGAAQGVEVASALAEAGADAVSVTAGRAETFHLSVPSEISPDSVLTALAKAVKEVVQIPVIAVGGLHDPLKMERILRDGVADLVAVGRGLIADPDLPRKAKEGRLSDIRPCLACGSPECHGRVFQQLRMGCVVNPLVGRETDFHLTQAESPRRVAVIGAGPAGMEAARTLALRGHSVVIYERARILGGQLTVAAKAPTKGLLRELIAYYEHQLAALGVRIQLDRKMDLAGILETGAETVVVATGAEPLIPRIEGLGAESVTAWDVLAGKKVGASVAVIGGGIVGCNTADYLAIRGHRVMVVEMLPGLATELAPWNRRLYTDKLVSLGVEFLLNCRVERIEGDRLMYNQVGYRSWLSGVDTVVLATGAVPNDTLSGELRTRGVETWTAGDCREPRNAGAAIREGFEAGVAI